jgi:AIPR protein
MPTFRYVCDKSYLIQRSVPYQPGVTEVLFYSRAADLPLEVPHGCNPRDQNINKPTYKKVAESFKDRADRSFHLKNKGITILVKSVTIIEGPGRTVYLDADIPDHLGSVDGKHSYDIVTTLRDENPDQMISVRILEGLEKDLIPKVAEGLNTSVQVSDSTMAEFKGLFDGIHKVMKGRPYYPFIGFKENQVNTSVNVNTLINLLWVAHPTMHESDTSARSPVWVYARPQSVLQSGYYKEGSEVRRLMDQMIPVLPQLIDFYRYFNEVVPQSISKRSRKMRGQAHSNFDGSKPTDLAVRDFLTESSKVPFRNPEEKIKVTQMMPSYLMLLMSGLRAFLTYDEDDEQVVWKLHPSEVRTILEGCMNKVLKEILIQLKSDKGDHSTTTRQPALFNSVVMLMERALKASGY